MKYILDASVAVKWVIPEIDSAVALRLRDDFRTGNSELLAPQFFPAECGHALFRLARRRLITGSEASGSLVGLMGDCPRLIPFVGLMPRASILCQNATIGFYDALYVALAEQEGCQLVTADVKLVANIGSAFPFVIALSSVP
jgi:predicted nucleic acid-binding protein